MELTLLHPKLVHLPIALSVMMPFAAAVLMIVTRRGRVSHRSWLVAALFQAILVGSGFLATTAGEEDAERVKTVVEQRYVDEHEDAAEWFVWIGLAVLYPFVQAGLSRNERRRRIFGVVALVGSLLVLSLAYRTGDLGGKLVYRYGAANAFIPQPDSTAQPP